MANRLIFLALVLGILGSGFTYLGLRLAHDLWQWLLLALPFLVILSLPFFVWRGDRSQMPAAKLALVHTAYLAMGFLSFLFVATILRDLVWMASMAVGGHWPMAEAMLGNWAVVMLAILAVLAGTIHAMGGARLREIDIVIDDLPADLHELRIVQISDLHVSSSIKRQYVDRVVQASNELEPHFVMLTGDVADGTVENLHEDIAPLANLRSSQGVFYVPGNHEYYWNLTAWAKKLSDLGARVLLNENHFVEMGSTTVLIGGITDPAAVQLKSGEPPIVTKAFHQDGDFKILLSHRPGFAQEAADLGFDLQLSGHTHGGQFFPWTLVTPLVHRYNLGLYQVGAMWIYVSGGTGTWGPLLRLGTTPELTLIRLKARA